MSELDLQISIADYIRLRYPDVLFRSDLGGIKLTIGQAVQAKRLNGCQRGWPDMFVAEPRGMYLGLFGEVKTDESEVWTKKFIMRRNKHIIEQSTMLLRLRELGYCADFWYGFDDAVKKIDQYLQQPKFDRNELDYAISIIDDIRTDYSDRAGYDDEYPVIDSSE